MPDAPPGKVSPGNASNGPKVSGTRTMVSLVLLVVVLIVCAIELRAGLGHYLTLKAFNKDSVSENNLFKNISYEDAKGMIAAFPSKFDVKQGEIEDVHHYYWYSLLRPLMGEGSPEVFMTVDHSEPANAISFYTSTEGEVEIPPFDPNAPPSVAPSMGMGGGMPGMGMGGGRNSEGGDREGRGGDRPAMEDENESPKPDAEPTDAPGEPANTPADETPEPKLDASPEPATEDVKSEAPAEPK
jgi:hypothetical protein